MCQTCNYSPCACSYIAELMPGGAHDSLADLAQRLSWAPSPHRPACPCPGCYSARLTTWTAGDEDKTGDI